MKDGANGGTNDRAVDRMMARTGNASSRFPVTQELDHRSLGSETHVGWKEVCGSRWWAGEPAATGRSVGGQRERRKVSVRPSPDSSRIKCSFSLSL